MTGLKEFLDKSLESQKEEFDTIKKLTKKNEESLSQLQTEVYLLNYITSKT